MPHDSILENILPHLSSLWEYLRLGFYVLGLGLTFWSLWQMAFHNRTQGLDRLWPAVAAGILFLNLPAFMDALAQTFLGQNSVQTLSYQPPAHPAQAYIRFAVFLAALAGLAALGRGLWLLKDSAQDRGLLSRSLIHIAGGIVCINLVDTVRIIAQALGGGLPDVVRTIFG
jgi:hypothetical protein